MPVDIPPGGREQPGTDDRRGTPRLREIGPGGIGGYELVPKTSIKSVTPEINLTPLIPQKFKQVFKSPKSNPIRELIQTIYVSIDDTDIKAGPRGTGRLARSIADTLAEDYPVFGVTRHQLYVHPDIPYTSHNSNAVIHVEAEGDDAMDHIFEVSEGVMLGDFFEGSDPGLAVASSGQIAPPLIIFGQDAKCIVLTQERARTLAKNLKIRLKGLGGTQDGVIGAMAGIGLAFKRNDGRFLQLGSIRDIRGLCPIDKLLLAGVDAAWTLDGRRVSEGTVVARPDKPARPCPIDGRNILFVEERDGTLTEVRRD